MDFFGELIANESCKWLERLFLNFEWLHELYQTGTSAEQAMLSHDTSEACVPSFQVR